MSPKALDQLLPENSECVRLLRSLDCSSMGAGALEQWPQSLWTALSICLASRSPMIVFWGPEHTLLYNDAFLPGLGTKHPAAMGRRAEECFSEIWDVIGPMLHAVLERGEAIGPTDLLLPPDHGEFMQERRFTFSFSPIRVEDGIGGVFCVVTAPMANGIGPRRLDGHDGYDGAAAAQSAQVLHRLNAEPEERRVADRTVALEDLTERLRRLAAELTQTEQRERKRLADVIHNHLQQLLVGAKIWVRAAQTKSGEIQGRQSLALALSLLDQAIAESRSLTVQLRPPALYESGLIAALRWLAGWMEKTHGLKVVLDLERQAEPDVEHGAVLLFEAARELLLNAVKHAGVDEVEMSLSRADDNRLCLSVADRGKGFDALTGAWQHGGGFGLFSIREQLHVIGGALEVESAPGNGTTARLFLPMDAKEIARAAAPEQASSPAPEQSAPPCGIVSQPAADQIKVLLVDDHSMIRDGIACILEEEGDIAVIAEVADGQAAVEAAQSLKPDVAVIDLNMPGMNGVKTTRAIIEKEPEIKIVGLSIHDDDAARQSMLDAGARAYLLKDGPAEVLIETVRGCVEELSPLPSRSGS